MISMSPFFSIIIPVYNVAPYLRECLDSVLAQTFADWEAICVDDGSTDGSGAILDEYAAKDKRFVVIHQNNAGVSAARNHALGVVKGEWFLFLDGDDVLRIDGLSEFLPFVRNTNIDGVLVHPYIPYWRGGVVPPRTVVTKEIVKNASKEDMIVGPYAANGLVISRVYKRKIFGGVRFPVNIKMAEDVCYWFDALCLDAKWVIINAEYYLYRQRPDSVCGAKDPHHCVQALQAVLYALRDIDKMTDVSDSLKLKYMQRFPYTVVHNLNLAIANFKSLSLSELGMLQSECEEIERVVGCWPYGTWARTKLLMLTSCCWKWLLPVVAFGERIYYHTKNIVKILCRKMA